MCKTALPTSAYTRYTPGRSAPFLRRVGEMREGGRAMPPQPFSRHRGRDRDNYRQIPRRRQGRRPRQTLRGQGKTQREREKRKGRRKRMTARDTERGRERQREIPRRRQRNGRERMKRTKTKRPRKRESTQPCTPSSSARFTQTLTLLGRRPAVRRKPLKSGRRPRSPCPRRRPSVGNRRL